MIDNGDSSGFEDNDYELIGRTDALIDLISQSQPLFVV